MKTIKTLVLAAALLSTSLSAISQSKPTYKIVGNELVRTDSIVKKKPIKTTLKPLNIKGIKYPVYKGIRGGYYILKVNKKTGKMDKRYLKVEK